MEQDIEELAAELLAGTFTPEPWELYNPEAGPDVFDGYRLWHDDGIPGITMVASGFCQGRDDGLGDATFAAASPMLVRKLLERIGELRRKIQVAEDFLGRELIPSDWPPMPENVSRIVTFRGVCRTCVAAGRVHAAANWISCPTGGWWSHLIHPEDDHEADIGWQPEQAMDDHGHYYTLEGSE